MKAVVIHAARDLRVEDRPVAMPGEGEVEVAIKAGGICGSDLHYYTTGGFGAIRVIDPMILGHEVSGEVRTLGSGVSGLSIGDRVAVNPSLPCRTCKFCLKGQPNHCLDMRFYGSAMRRPHVDGAFRESLVAKASQCIAVPPDMPFGHAAFAEPLAVVLNGVQKAGPLVGRRVHVAGCGPIGALAVLVARAGGAAEIVATDMVEGALAIVRKLGADRAIDIVAEPDAMAAYGTDKGYFDVMFEASGNGEALRTGLDVVRPGGRIVQLGLGGDITLPQNTVVAKELTIRGTFRFHDEFAIAAGMIAEGKLDIAPLLTETIPVERAKEAFDLATDRNRAMKVHLAFG